MKNIYKIILITLLLISATSTEASSLYFEPANVSSDINNLFKIDLLLDTDGELINAIGGEVIIPENLIVKDIFYGESVVTFWIEKPILDGNKIVFSGIIPGGFKGVITPNKYLPGNIISLVVESKSDSNSKINLENVQILLDDGKGTEVSNLILSNFNYYYNQNIKLDSLDFNDNIPPEDFTVELIEEDGDNFLIFYAQDKESGVKYYEIKIDDGEWKIVSSPYKITNKQLKKDIIIKAVDGFGNTTISKFNNDQPVDEKPYNKIIFVVLLIVAVTLVIFFKRFNVKRKL